MENMRPQSPVVRLVAEAMPGPLVLIDVGCSGGVDPAWRAFGDKLAGFGFDPSLHEIERLSREETNPALRYVGGFVGLPDGHPLKGASRDPWRVDPWGRLAAYRTQERQQGRPVGPIAATPVTPKPKPEAAAPVAAPPSQAAPDADQQDLMQRNLWREARLSSGTIHLPDFLRDEGVGDVDFVKIDVDGTDFEILRSIEATLSGSRVLGLQVEVNFNGSADEHHNTFHNTDRFLRAQGFDLFDLSVRRYALAALPFPYLYEHPVAGQSLRGRPFQGDALYLRDFGYPLGGLDAADWPDDKLLKLVGLCALYGLLDQAAEILVMFRGRLQPLVDIDQALDLLAAEAQAADPELSRGFEPFAGYREYLAAYEADHRYFYGANRRRYEAGVQPIVERDEARAERDRAHERIAASEAELSQAREEAEDLRTRLDAVLGSTSWRLTAPLRGLLNRILRRG